MFSLIHSVGLLL